MIFETFDNFHRCCAERNRLIKSYLYAGSSVLKVGIIVQDDKNDWLIS